jgi:hypothetical protein
VGSVLSIALFVKPFRPRHFQEISMKITLICSFILHPETVPFVGGGVKNAA